MKRINQTEKVVPYIIGFLWPIWALILSIHNFRLPYAKNIFILFCGFFGFIFIYNTDVTVGADSGRYAEYLRGMYFSDQSFAQLMGVFYKNESNVLDIFQPVLTFIISRFTYDPQILFLITALIFGYFYSRNLWFVFERINQTVTFVLFICMLYYFLVCPIWNINGMRMWTALHVFVFGALPYLLNGTKKSLIWCGVSVFFHFSFVIPLFIIGFFAFLPKYNLRFYFILFVVASFIREINLTSIHNFISEYSPAFLQGKVDSYINVETADMIIENTLNLKWYIILTYLADKVGIYIFIVAVYTFLRKSINRFPNLIRLFSFALFIYAFSQILSLMPSGSRFITLSKMFIIPVIIIYLDRFRSQKGFIKIGFLASLLILPRIILELRGGFETIGLSILGNPIISLFFEDKISILELIKQFLS